MNPTFQHLLDNTTHPDPETRIAALDAIGQWSAEHDDNGLTRAAVTCVAASLQDDDRDVRWAAAYALGALGHAEGGAALLDVLGTAQDDPGLRLVIIKALGKIDGTEAIPALEVLAAECDSRCERVAAARSLARLGAAPA